MSLKNQNLIIVLGVVILIALVSFFILIREPVPLQDVEIQNDVVASEEKVAVLVSELMRFPGTQFIISINGNVEGLYNRILTVGIQGEQIQVPVIEGAAVLREIIEQPAENIALEEIGIGDTVFIQAEITILGELAATVVVVTPM